MLLAASVGLDLENRAAEHRVDPAAHLGRVGLGIEVGRAGAEAVAEQVMEVRPNLLMAWPRDKLGDNLFAAGAVHAGELMPNAGPDGYFGKVSALALARPTLTPSESP